MCSISSIGQEGAQNNKEDALYVDRSISRLGELSQRHRDENVKVDAYGSVRRKKTTRDRANRKLRSIESTKFNHKNGWSFRSLSILYQDQGSLLDRLLHFIRLVPVVIIFLIVGIAITTLLLTYFEFPSAFIGRNIVEDKFVDSDGSFRNRILSLLSSDTTAYTDRSPNYQQDEVSRKSVTGYSELRFNRYQLEEGETLVELSDRFGVTVDTLISFNGIKHEHDLDNGSELIIPNQSGLRYIVRRGDRLGRIADRHGVELSILEKVNGIKKESILHGQILLIPGVELGEKARNQVLGRIYIRPAEGQIIYGYGLHEDSLTGIENFHSGIDITNDTGTPIVASMGGTVIKEGFNRNYGRYLVIRHKGGFETLYAHLGKTTVFVEESVKQGQQIGQMGSTGYVTSGRLHFAIFLNGEHVDPVIYLE